MRAKQPAGIGPLISGWEEGNPVYYFEMVMKDGRTERVATVKNNPRMDRRAKQTAIWRRAETINKCRPEIVVTHDATSFDALVKCLSMLGSSQQAAVRAA